MNVGDLVQLPNRSGLWVFSGDCPAHIPSNAIGKFVRATNIDPLNHHEALSFSKASATVVVSPTFTPGEVVQFQDGTATVESDGESTVVLTYSRHVPVPPRGYTGEFFTQEGRVDANRAQLVIGNISKFIT